MTFPLALVSKRGDGVLLSQKTFTSGTSLSAALKYKVLKVSGAKKHKEEAPAAAPAAGGK